MSGDATDSGAWLTALPAIPDRFYVHSARRKGWDSLSEPMTRAAAELRVAYLHAHGHHARVIVERTTRTVYLTD